jgi:hypothetical protein
VPYFRLYCSARTYCSPEDGSGSQKISLLTVATTSSVLTILSTDTSSHLNPLSYYVLHNTVQSRYALTDFRSYGALDFSEILRGKKGKPLYFLLSIETVIFREKFRRCFLNSAKFDEIRTRIPGIISEINGPDPDFGAKISEKLSEIRLSIHSNIVSYALFPSRKEWPQSPKLS